MAPSVNRGRTRGQQGQPPSHPITHHPACAGLGGRQWQGSASLSFPSSGIRSIEEAGALYLLLMGRTKPPSIGAGERLAPALSEMTCQRRFFSCFSSIEGVRMNSQPRPLPGGMTANTSELLPALSARSFMLCIPVKSHFPSCQVRRHPGVGGGCWSFWGIEKYPTEPQHHG